MTLLVYVVYVLRATQYVTVSHVFGDDTSTGCMSFVYSRSSTMINFGYENLLLEIKLHQRHRGYLLLCLEMD